MRYFLILVAVIFVFLLAGCRTAEKIATATLVPLAATVQPPTVPPTPTDTPEPTETPSPTATANPLTTVGGANQALIAAGLPGSAERIEIDTDGNTLAYDAEGAIIARVMPSGTNGGDTQAVWAAGRIGCGDKRCERGDWASSKCRGRSGGRS